MLLPPSATSSAVSDTVAPAVSSSVTVTATPAMVTASYSLALRAATTAWLMDAASFTASASWSARTVTVCAVSQLDGVKVRVAWLPNVAPSVSTVTSVLSLLTVITTSEAGGASSTTV